VSIKRILILFLAAAALLGLAACSASAPAALKVEVKARDIAFDVTTIEAKVGQPVELTYENIGALEHNFVIEDFNVNETVKPGETLTFSFVADEAGAFDYKCNVPGHTEAGMVGTLVVKP